MNLGDVMKRLIYFLTKAYDDEDTFIQIKARHMSIILLLITLSIILESVFELYYGVDKIDILTTNFIGLVLFLSILTIIKTGHLLIAGNLLVFGGGFQLAQYFPITMTFQFYLQCFLILTVAVAVYIKKYQLYTIISIVVSFALIRIFTIQNSFDLINVTRTAFMSEIYQATASVFVYIVIIVFYDMVIASEIEYSRKLKYLSETDKLTGLYNRQKFKEVIASYDEINFEYCLAIMDIDYFKKVNDTYGHKVGDQVLVKISSTLQNYFKEDTDIFRWGGEEFALIYTGEHELFYEVLDRLRILISLSDFNITMPVTVSIGYLCSVGYQDKKTMMIEADRALYEAKNKGRNRIECAIRRLSYETD